MSSYVTATIEIPEEIIKVEFESAKKAYRRQLANMLKSFISGAIHKYQFDYGVEVVQEMTVRMLENGVEINLRVYLDEESLAEIRRRVEMYLKERRATTLIWTKTLKKIKEGSLKSSSGELDALLPNSAQRPAEAFSEVRGDRAKVRSQEGRPHFESDSETDKRGVHVSEE